MSESNGAAPVVDLLMITFDQPQYVEKSLARLIETATERTRIWVWHNGTDEATLAVSKRLSDDSRVHRFHHSPENARLLGPTNWLYEEADGDYVGKIDDDCLLEHGWIERLLEVHETDERFGVLGSWRFPDEDFDARLAAPKMVTYPSGHTVLRNLWVQGSGHLMKRRCVEQLGPMREGLSFPKYCIELSALGWINGWPYPFVREEHMDDPRSPHTRFTTDADLRARLPLTARMNGVDTIEDWTEQLRRSAINAQTATLDVRQYRGWRRTRTKAWRKARRLVGIKRQW
ncbi:MAG: glycosyltransferase [Actinomycetota bacterium]